MIILLSFIILSSPNMVCFHSSNLKPVNILSCQGLDKKHKMIHACNKKVRVQTFEVGQRVLKCIIPYQEEYKSKFAPNWQEP